MRWIALKLATLAFLLLLLAFTGLRLWSISYRCINSQLAGQVEAETMRRIERREAVTSDANGWWDLCRVLQLPPLPISGPVDLPPELEQANLSRWIRPLEPASKSYRQPSFQQAFLNYRQLLKALTPAMTKKNLCQPSNWKLGCQKSPSPRVGLDYAFRNAQIYADYLSFQGDSQQALTVIFQHLDLAEKIGQQGTISQGCTYSQGQSYCLDELQSLFPSLSLSQLDDCQKRLARMNSAIQNFLGFRNESYLEQLQSLKLVAAGQSPNPSLEMSAKKRVLWRCLGLFQREDAAIRNLYLTQRARIEEGQLAEDFGQTAQAELKAVQQQAHSYLLEEICEEAGYSYPQACCLRAQAALEAARISCAIRRYQKRHGSVPITLEELCPESLPTLPHNPVTADGRYTYQKVDYQNYILESKYRPAVRRALEPEDAEGANYCRPPTRKQGPPT